MPTAVGAAALRAWIAPDRLSLALPARSRRDPLAQICGGVACVFAQVGSRTGEHDRPQDRARPNTLVALLYNAHTEQEKTTLAARQIRQLLDGRPPLQQLLEDELKAIVENASGASC